MSRQRSQADEQVADLLQTAKKSLGLSVAFLSRLDGTTQFLEVVESSVPFLFKEGATQRQATTFCQAILDGKLPAVIPDVKAFPAAMELPAARLPRIRSYVSVPVVLSDGSMYGTFCAAGLTSDKGLTKRDKSLMDVLAHAAAVIIEPGVAEASRRARIEARLRPVIDAGGPTVVLQPIVDLATGTRIGAEALSRFPAEWGQPPDVCFAEAHSVGLGHVLELLAIERAAEYLETVSGYVALNISPGTLLTAEAAELLGRLPVDRILLELSEHAPVDDYAALTAALAPARARGMRLAIDDVGAGFSSLRHIVLTGPEVIKLDRSMVAGVSEDPVLRTLVKSLVDFGHGCAATVVAEGIETRADAEKLLELGVDDGQGWYYGRPGGPEHLSECWPVVGRPAPATSAARSEHGRVGGTGDAEADQQLAPTYGDG
jgi:EAL domain-containing protein (putative c-di-GMP-specific phosphodiesterase class I)